LAWIKFNMVPGTATGPRNEIAVPETCPEEPVNEALSQTHPRSLKAVCNEIDRKDVVYF
jgi:hypothetical protein